MKNSRKLFVLAESILGIVVIILASMMFMSRNKRVNERVSVIIPNPDDNQWAAFKYGLKMAAEDYGVEMFVVSRNDVLTGEDEDDKMGQEVYYREGSVILEPYSKEGYFMPVVGPDNYAMGQSLARELLKDCGSNIKGKTLGILSETDDKEALADRKSGFCDTLLELEAEIVWTACVEDFKEGKGGLESLPLVDFVVGLDDVSVTMAGECSAARNLHGALVYGIGNSTEAVYYLDTDIVECLVVPDEFDVGYQSLAEIAKCLKNRFYKMEEKTVSHTVLRKNMLFSDQVQEIIFTMSQ